MATTPADASPAPIRVLCVDDDRDFRELVAIYLGERREDLSVDTAPDGQAVLERLAEGGIDCIVSDYRMPRMDGLELLSEIRQTHPDLPFILFTGRGGEDIASDAVSAGVTDYIRKSTDPDQFGLLANRIRNVVERHRARVQYQAIFDSVSEAVLVIDPSSQTVIDANRRAGELWGYSEGDLIGRPVDELRVSPRTPRSSGEDRESVADSSGPPDRQYGPGDAEPDAPTPSAGNAEASIFPESSAILPGFERADERETEITEWHCIARDGSRFWGAVSQRRAEIDGRERTLVIVRDVTRRKVRQRQLDELLETVRELLVVETEEEIADAVMETTIETLRFDDAGLFLLEREGGGFRVVGADESNEVVTGNGDSAIQTERLWDALDSGEIVLGDSHGPTQSNPVSSSDDDNSLTVDSVAPPTAAEASRIYIPIGDIGVLCCARGAETDSNDVELAALLATFAAGAFDRARRETLLREREETLRTQRDELLALDHVNAVIRDINQALVSVSSREGIERLVCEKFAATDQYQLAWMGEYDSGTQSVVPTASAGHDEGFLPDQIEVDEENSPSIAAVVKERSVVVVDRISPKTVPEARYRLARERGFRSVAFVPVVHQNVLYRILAVYSDEHNAFGDRERAVLGELGETIGLAIAAAEWRSGRISDTIVDLELSVEHDEGLFALVSGPEKRLELTDMRETADGSIRVFGRLYGTPFDEFEAAVSSVTTLDDPVLLAERADSLRVAYTIRSGPLFQAITTGGVTLRSGTIAAGTGTFHLTIPLGTEVRSIVARFEDAFDTVELVGRRDRSREQPSDRLAAALEQLTDRQQEILRMAYHAGFFEVPREASGSDVAELLGVSQPTFNEHLRNAERRLFNTLLDS